MEKDKKTFNKKTKIIVLTTSIIFLVLLIVIPFMGSKNKEEKNISMEIKPDTSSTEKNYVSDIKPVEQNSINPTNAQIDSSNNNSETQNEINALKDKINALENKSSITNTVIPEKTTADIVTEWKNRVAEVLCEWRYSNGTVYQVASGSGMLVNISGLGLVTLTNKHVLQTDTGYFPQACKVYTWDPVFFREVKVQLNSFNPFSYKPNLDMAKIELDTSATVQDNMTGDFSENTNTKLCTNVNIGDKLVVLGYPAIGASTGLTATEGIISGIEQNYYVTDAKIDHGNSGGVAVLLKDDCWLGIPSSSVVGQIESMGRILKGNLVYQ